jgi:DNA-binding NarL/FixJ family response regulator
VDPPDDHVAAKVAGLSERQRRVLRLAAAGASTREIGQRIHAPLAVVEHELALLLRSLGVRTTDQAALVWWGSRAGSHPHLADAARDLIAEGP